MTQRTSLTGKLSAFGGARIETSLGSRNVFDMTDTQRTYAQDALGDFSGPRRVAGGDITATGPDAVYPAARIQNRTINFASMGFSLESGHTAFAALVCDDGQSLALGATEGSSSLPASREINSLPPMPGKYLCFNNGICPRNSSPGGETALNTALTSAEIASVVDCADYINPLVQRDTPIFSAGLMIADALRHTNDKVFALSFAVGSTSLSERLVGFTGSRASGTLSISGTTATITVSSGSLNADNLILVGTGIAADTYITTVPAPTGTGTFSVQVSPSQTVASTSFTTQDQKPRQYKNYLMAIDAFATWARGQNLTPILPFFLWIGGNAESDSVAVANARNQNLNLRTVVNAFALRLHGAANAAQVPWIIDAAVSAPRTNVNHDPVANEGDDTPDLSNMGLVNNMTLSSGQMARAVDVSGARYDTRWVSCATYHHPTTTGARVHIGDDPIGYIYMGGDMGMTAIDIANGEDARWPAITRVARVKGNLNVAVTFSEACEFSSELIGNPGQYGLKYTGGGTEVAISAFAWSGATLTLTLASEPTGAEVLSYACDNATLFEPIVSTNSPFGPVSGGLASGGYPWTQPGYGLGNQTGQRGSIRGTAIPGYCVQTGRPLYRYANQQKATVDVTAGTGTIAAMHETASITPAFLVDTGDPACYPGSGQTIIDLSGAAELYWLGIDGTTANDPAYVAASGGIPSYLRFDGGGGAGVKSGQICKAQGSPTFLANLHKTGGAAVFIAAFYMPAAPTYSAIQYLLANCRNGSGGGPGVAFRVSTAGNPGFNIRGASNANVMSVNLPTETRVVAGWNVMMIGIQEGGTGWAWVSNGSRYLATLSTFACTYTSPSSDDPEASPIIGGNYQAAVANIDSLFNGSGIGAIGVGPWGASNDYLPLFRSVCAAYGLEVGPLP